MKRDEALKLAQNCFRKAITHSITQQFRIKCNEDFNFYNGGLGQWREADLAALNKKGQSPHTLNVCKSFVDNLSGVEIQSRYRTAVRSDSGDKNEDELASALTHLLYFIQENESIPYKGSLKFRDCLICGIGWSGVEYYNNKIHYKYISPFEIFPDPEDLSDQYTGMRFVCRKMWLSTDRAVELWPKLKDYAGKNFGSDSFYASINSVELLDRQNVAQDTNSAAGLCSEKCMIVEVQYKVPSVYYEGTDSRGRIVSSYKIEDLEEINVEKIIEKKCDRIMRVLFFNDMLLEYAPLDEDFPGRSEFSYIPIVFKKNQLTGVPYGIIDAAKDIQRWINVCFVRSIYLYNTRTIVIEGNIYEGKDRKSISESFKSLDSVIFLPLGTNYKIHDNSALGDDHLKLFDVGMNAIYRAVGMSEEPLGIQTNATSAIAQKTRQANSVRNSVFVFDNFFQMRKREFKLILGMYQSVGIRNILMKLFSDEESKVITLNETVFDDNGKIVDIENNIISLPMSLYIEEVPDYRSYSEEERDKILSLFSSPFGSIAAQSPELLEAFGMRNGRKLAEKLSSVINQQNPIRPVSVPQDAPNDQSEEMRDMVSGEINGINPMG